MPPVKKKTTPPMGKVGTVQGMFGGGLTKAQASAMTGVRQALLVKISAKAREDLSASELLELAEAYAWINSPDQAHGGQT
jgi:hypothetical protein